MEFKNYTENIYKEFLALLAKYFPEYIFKYSGYAGLTFHAELASENKLFQHTPYFYQGDLNFVHWTSINNLFSILNNREIRLYNLFNSEDEDEFLYAANVLGLEPGQIEHLKKYYFAFSFCKLEDLSNQHLWNNYGNVYKGVAVQFSIENNPLNWDDFMISTVYYNVPEKYKEFANAINNLREDYGADFKGLNMGKLIGFHKKKNFENEKEVRLATFFPFKDFEESLKFTKPEFRINSKRNRITEYLSIPLWVDNNSANLKSDNPKFSRVSQFDSEYFKTRPMIKLQNIFFGNNCGLTNSEFYTYRQKLIDLIRFNYGYTINLAFNLYK